MKPRFSLVLPLCVVLAIVSWASAYPVTRMALQEMSPLPLAATRYALAGGIALLWLLVTRPPFPALKDWPQLIACGATGITLYNILFNNGEVTVSSGATSLLLAAMPLISALLASVFLGEHLLLRGWIGSLMSFTGVALISLNEGGGMHLGKGTLFIIGAACCGALYTNLQRRLIRKYGALPVIAYVLIIGGILLSPWLMAGITRLETAGAVTRWSVIELAVLPAALGYAAWGYVIGQLGAARGVLFMYLLPPVTMLLAFALSGEVPRWSTLEGGSVVMAGLALATFPARRKVPVIVPETVELGEA
ncbi:DMT family transporter [Neokomagataea anthophila]|uniref:EamA family transporter n=1 Tax=Neokomagataea anthophila TaxID=2826925 RepID=A0ABS5E9I7_9PROT|nr:EamA family transporter [Neokomagataea anthophila]MBR0560539.1 EamA family transporter [Neokomagataea anthophila]